MKITDAEKKALKGRGYIMNRDGEHFVARLITVNGVLTSSQFMAAAEAAEKYGSGQLAMTSRLTIEVQGLTYETIEPFDACIKAAGLYTGGTGSRVRPIVACKGTVCVHGLIDTQGLARELHEKFYKGWYDVKLPHKFKIGIGGCPNNCIKPSLNDFGIMGQRVPAYDPDDCNGCKKCSVVDVCPVKAAQLDEDGIMQIDRTVCNNCGKCVDACRFDCVTEEKMGYRIFVGGLWGKRQRLGTMVDEIYTKEQVFEMVERALLLYREQGRTGERFGMFIERIGVDNFIGQLKAGDVMERKQAILDAPLHLEGGASC
ncbi:4Fe-4S dicluster domain-containing protein [Clostridium phoceensis]|uniref:4Fe-4S dicluster domain-containing protein n=1 Tax=Clostridium phoceensis TaxID=1650661 RepID=UPI00067F5ADB|nr:(4Fe-4S)-binding protein [Clostridium phoceensis]